jgi:inorganic pyrophosphatase
MEKNRSPLDKTDSFDIQEYRTPLDFKSLRDNHVPYTGSPRKHPYDSKKVILIADPYSYNSTYFEFRIKDVSHIEKLPNLVDVDGNIIQVARVWVKRKSLAILCSPFVVEDTRSKS